MNSGQALRLGLYNSAGFDETLDIHNFVYIYIILSLSAAYPSFQDGKFQVFGCSSPYLILMFSLVSFPP